MYLETLQTTTLGKQVNAIKKLARRKVRELQESSEKMASEEEVDQGQSGTAAPTSSSGADEDEVQIVQETSESTSEALQTWKEVLSLAAKLTSEWRAMAKRELKRQRERAIAETRNDINIESSLERAERLRTLDHFVQGGSQPAASTTESNYQIREARVKLGAGFDGHYVTQPITVEYSSAGSSSSAVQPRDRKRRKT